MTATARSGRSPQVMTRARSVGWRRSPAAWASRSASPQEGSGTATAKRTRSRSIRSPDDTEVAMRRASLPGRGAVAALGGLLLVSGLAFVPASAGAGSGLVVLRDVRASHDDIPLGKVTYPISATKPQPDTQIEPSIAVNPGNPLNAVAVFQEDRVDAGGDAGNGYTSTLDGGKTWAHGYLPGLTTVPGGTFDRASDAVVTFAADPAHKGRYIAYANSLVFNDGSGASGDANQSGMAINISRDGGRTWSKAV